MKYFTNDKGIGDGDPDKIREHARQLANVVGNMDRTVRLMQQVTVRGSWDSPSGDTFAAKVADTPSSLIDVANRLRSTAQAIRPYADLLEASQKALTGYDEDASRAKRTMDDRDATLEAMAPDDPDRARVQRERGEAVVALVHAEKGFEKELQEAHADESRMAAKLHDVSEQTDDPGGYDFWEGLSTMGQSASKIGILAKPVALAGVADPVGKAGLRHFYDEGSYADVAKSSAGFALDTATFGAGRIVKAARSRFVTKDVARVNSIPGKPVRIKDNPIITPGRTRSATASTGRATSGYPTKHYAPLPSKVPASVRDVIRRKAGVDDVEDAFDDWEIVAGEGRIAKASVVVQLSTKQGKRGYSAAKRTHSAGKEAGVTNGSAERKEVQQQRRASADRLAEGHSAGR